MCEIVVVCVREAAGGGGGEGGGGARDTESKTRTPHKDVGKKHLNTQIGVSCRISGKRGERDCVFPTGFPRKDLHVSHLQIEVAEHSRGIDMFCHLVRHWPMPIIYIFYPRAGNSKESLHSLKSRSLLVGLFKSITGLLRSFWNWKIRHGSLEAPGKDGNQR